MENEKKEQSFFGPYNFTAKIPLGQAIPLGLQHVLAMFVGNLTPILIITSACAAMSDEEQFAAVQVSLLRVSSRWYSFSRSGRWAARCRSSWVPARALLACFRAWRR